MAKIVLVFYFFFSVFFKELQIFHASDAPALIEYTLYINVDYGRTRSEKYRCNSHDQLNIGTVAFGDFIFDFVIRH